jgi:hypothetical protein
MSRRLDQSTARDLMVFMALSSDHITGATGKTLAISASKAGGAFASISPTVTERGNGWYSIALTSDHTDTVGDLALHITEADCDPTDLVVDVIAPLLTAADYSAPPSAVSIREEMDDNSTKLASIEEDTQDIQNRLPAALTPNGRIDADAATVGVEGINADSFAAGTYAAALFDADFFTRIWDEGFSGDTAAGHLVAAKSNGDSVIALLGGVLKTSTMTSVGTETLINDATLTEVDDYWVGCRVRMIGTDNAGLHRFIVASTSGQLEVYPPFPHSMPSGHAYQILGSPAPASPKAVAEMLLDLAATVDGLTVRQALRVALAALAGKSSGGPLNDIVRAVDDSKPRITVTVDGTGHRTAVEVDAE